MRKMTFGVRSVLFAVLAVMLFSASGDVLGESWESDVEKESEISETIKQDFLTEKSFGVINKNILENIFQKNLNSKNIYDNLYQFSDKCWKLIDNDSADLEKVAQELFTEEYAQQLLKDNDEEKYRKISELCKSLHTFADSFWPSRRDTKALEASVEKLNHKESSEITQKLRDNQVSREEEKSNISEPSSDTNIATVENKIDSSDHAEDKVKTSDAKKIQQDSIQLTSPAANNGEDTAAPGASAFASASPLTSPAANNGEDTAVSGASASDTKTKKDGSEVSTDEINKWRKSARASELLQISQGEKIFEILEKNIAVYRELHTSTDDEKKIDDIAKNVILVKNKYNAAVDIKEKNLNKLQYNTTEACAALTTAFKWAKELASIGVYKIAKLTQDEENTFFRSALREKLEQFMDSTQVIQEDITKLLTLLPTGKMSAIKSLLERINYIGTEALTDDQRTTFDTAKNTIAQVVNLDCKTTDFPFAVKEIKSAINEYNKVALTPIKVLDIANKQVIDEAFRCVARGLAHYMRENLMYMLTNVRDGACKAKIQLKAECEKMRPQIEDKEKEINASYEQRIVANKQNPKGTSLTKANVERTLLDQKQTALMENKKPLNKKEKEFNMLESYESETDEAIKRINEDGQLITESTTIEGALQIMLTCLKYCQDAEEVIKDAAENFAKESVITKLEQEIRLIYTPEDIKKEFQQIIDSCDAAKQKAK